MASKDKEKSSDHSDHEVVKEFGGALGTTMIMIFSPVLMYYLWICLEYYNGQFQYPKHPMEISFFLDRMWSHILDGAVPSFYTAKIYFSFVLFEMVLAVTLPGPKVYGIPIPHEGNRRLEYLCNGVATWWVSILTAGLLHYFNIFRITEVIDNFGKLMSTAIIVGNVVTILTYFIATTFGKGHRMSGSFLYDVFMGAILNPRIGPLDLKMFAEIRIPWPLLFFISVSAAAKQYEVYGKVSSPLIFMCLAHFLYTNACHKGEECVPSTWDVFYEKWGYMLIFWNLAGVPFVYCHASYYLYKLGPFEHSRWVTISLFTLLLVAYYVWDTANSQKNRFRMQLRKTYVPRWAFPQLPWGTLKNPKYLKTANGSTLLVDGWWAYARKIHYSADLCMALSYGLICGFGSFIPYFYVFFFLCVLTHRATRDMSRCAKKYKEDWTTYCKTVPYLFIPYVFQAESL